MRLNAPNVRIADVETCDFGLVPRYDTATVLRAAQPDRWEHYLAAAVSRKLIAELGVEQRHLTQLPGELPDPARLNAFDLARSAVQRLQARRGHDLDRLDALVFVSTSNPNPVNSQAALLASKLGLRTSCMDLKAGCSSGVLGIMEAALLIQAGCERVLVVMAENLSHLTDPEELRMLLTVGDGAACILVEAGTGLGFLSMIHGSAPGTPVP
jgi:3-oxoacyl-[acyl-carrier-protein] synthase III